MEPCLLESDVSSASVCKEHELSQVSHSLGCPELVLLTDDHLFWQNYSRLISFGLSDEAGWRQNTPGLNANAVPGAGRRAVYSSSKMCLGVQWSVKTQMQNQSYLLEVLPCPHCLVLLLTLFYNPIIWSQELRPYWEGTFNWFTPATLHVVLYKEFILSYLHTIMVTVGGKKRIKIYPPWKLIK